MKKTLFIITLMTVLSLNVSAQAEWEKTYNYSEYDEFPYSILELQDGSYLSGGNAFDGATQVACISKISSNGDSLWHKKFTGQLFVANLHINNEGDICAFIVNYDELRLVKIDTSTGDTSDTFLVPVDFSKGKTHSEEYLSHILLPNGDYIMSTIQLYGTIPGSIIFRFTPGNPQRLWENNLTYSISGGLRITGMLLDGDNIILSGYRRPPAGMNYIYLSSMALTDGTISWTKVYKPEINLVLSTLGLAKNSKGDYLIATTWDDVNSYFTLPAILMVSGTNGDSLKLSLLKQFDGKNIYGYCVKLIPNGNGFAAVGSMMWDEKAPDNSVNTIGNLTLFNVSDDGEFIGAENYNAMGGMYSYESNGVTTYAVTQDRGIDLIHTSDDKLLLLGSGTVNQKVYYYVKTAGNMSNLGIKESLLNPNFQVYPNPAKESVTISNLTIGSSLQIIDISGKVVYSMVVSNETATINIANFENGVYFISDKNGRIKKFIKE